VAGVCTILWLSLAGTSNIPVRAAVARPIANARGDDPKTALDVSGYVVARRQATVAAKITGKITEVLVEEGQRIEKDQVIARLDDSNAAAALAQAEAEIGEARAKLVAAKTSLSDFAPIFERDKALLASGWISRTVFDHSRRDYDEARTGAALAAQSLSVAEKHSAAARADEEDTVVRSPFSGVVTVKAAQPGEVVSPLSTGGFTRTGICTVVDMDSLEVEVDVSENFIPRVRPGQEASIVPNAYPDARLPGFVLAIVPTADRSKATVRVRVGFRKLDSRLVPEMGARVSFLEQPLQSSGIGATEHAGVVVIPPEAVLLDGTSGIVFVIHGDIVERRVVKLGEKTNDGQTILAGLTPGASVAIGPLSRLSDRAKVNIEEP
jgi:RND family efflux transporter MFP subunit